jgi:hypothetical protein
MKGVPNSTSSASDSVSKLALLPPMSDVTRREEKHDCEVSAETMEDVPNFPLLLPSADVEMFLPDGPAPVVECSAATAPKVRFLHPEFRMPLKPIHYITV